MCNGYRSVETLTMTALAAGPLRSAADPRVLAGEILVVLILAIAFRHPITAAIGTAGGVVPAVRTTQAIALHDEPYVEFPINTGAQADVDVDDPPAAAPVAMTPVSSAPMTYRVRRGDSLWQIAAENLRADHKHAGDAAVASQARKLYRANEAAIGANPSDLRIGVILRTS
jgi:nucleoid-associated protein YgaU